MLSVRELQIQDIDWIANYWLQSDPAFMQAMGVDLSKLPSRENLTNMLRNQLAAPHEKKATYALIWLLNNQPVGHCNVNDIQYGEQAFMHLHLWNNENRQKGMGSTLVKMTLPYFFSKLQLKRLICEPYALNPAPNKTLEKLGFELVKEYTTIPGSLSFEQPVKQWQLSREAWQAKQV